jgi:hypothetical protein
MDSFAALDGAKSCNRFFSPSSATAARMWKIARTMPPVQSTSMARAPDSQIQPQIRPANDNAESMAGRWGAGSSSDQVISRKCGNRKAAAVNARMHACKAAQHESAFDDSGSRRTTQAATPINTVSWTLSDTNASSTFKLVTEAILAFQPFEARPSAL